MLILVSGEGPTDMGCCVGVGPCEGDAFEPGPMACLVDQIAEHRLGFGFIDLGLMRLVSKASLATVSKRLRGATLPGPKRQLETAYYFRNARALAKLANELAANEQDDIVAILFRDADGTQSAGRGEWDAKWKSMLDGFQVEGFSSGAPMIPRPKSEAWLLCALKPYQPYQHCGPLEHESGNDASPNSLKTQLAEALGQEPIQSALADLVRAGRVDAEQIDMPSFVAFRARLIEILS